VTAFLAIEGLGVRFGGLKAVDGFSMEVQEGSIHALIGPNGAGKSTVFNCISRFCRPHEGRITFAGRDVLSLPAHGIIGAGIGRTFQNLELLRRMTVLETVLVGGTTHGARYLPFAPGRRRAQAEAAAIEAAEAILEETNLSEYRDTLAGELDFGHQKLLDLARALAGRPRLLLLDEPAAGLRNREISFVDKLLLRLARSRGLTVILVEHVMPLVMSVADHITVLSFGQKIAEGTPAEIRRHPEVIRAYLGSDADA
jgi:branched-chain amino acid transport system ATP-binding protein